MSVSKSQIIYSWKKELKEIFLISLIGIPWGYLTCLECEHKSWAIMISSTVWVVLWKGNQYVSHLMDLKYQWIKQPVHRLVLGLVGHTAVTVISMLSVFYIYELILNITLQNAQTTILISIGATFVITLILQSREFLISWRQLAVNTEIINKEAISARYETLKNQVNPHFLFNSLNVLTNLVYEDQDLAAKFIKKLSEVYRYVLDSREKNMVTLKEELIFVDSYIFLQKLRHSEGLNIDIQVDLNSNIGVAPLALQMLLENAIKHNIVSEEEPLSISLKTESDYLIVTNNLQKKNIVVEENSGVGLSNIKARYHYLSDKAVEVLQQNQQFIVRLPLLDFKP